MKIRIEGPYYGSYSLARVNRELAIALAKHDSIEVTISATEAESWRRDRTYEAEMRRSGVNYVDVRTEYIPDVVVRHTWPVESNQLKGAVNLRLFPWEETRIPSYLVDQFNTHYDAILAPSKFVKAALQHSGVSSEVIILENASDLKRGVPRAAVVPPTTCRFLHVSSCFPRKGADILVRAFAQEFRSASPVTLTIKSFWNPHNEVNRFIEQAREQLGLEMPNVNLILDDFSDEAVTKLIDEHDFMVMPSRGEGFGLPALEAHVRCRPCIMPKTTALGERFIEGVDLEVAAKLDYASSHTADLGSLWYEPDVSSLRAQMRLAAEMILDSPTEYNRRTQTLIAKEFGDWATVAAELIDKASQMLANRAIPRPEKLGKSRLIVISSYGQICGISTYAENLTAAAMQLGYDELVVLAPKIADADCRPISHDLAVTILRCWNYWGEVSSELRKAYEPRDGDRVIIQHHTGFFSPLELQKVLTWLGSKRVTGSVTLHSVLDNNFDSFHGTYPDLVTNMPDSFVPLVHSLPELEYLNSDRVVLFPHPFQDHLGYGSCHPACGTGLVASFGFMRRHKGYRELIEAWPSVLRQRPDARLLLLAATHPASDSAQELDHCRWLVDQLGLAKSVVIVSEFLDDATIQALLGYSDLVVFPYKDNSEGASGAVRIALSSHAAVVTSNALIFREFHDLVGKFTNKVNIADQIVVYLNDNEKTTLLRNRTIETVGNNSYSFTAKWIDNLIS